MTEPYYDGAFGEATQNGPVIPSIDPVSRGRIWKQPMLQQAGLWAPLALDTELVFGSGEDAVTSVLVEETEASGYGADLIAWERIYAEVPATHQTAATFSYSWHPQLEGGQTVATMANVINEYFLTAAPENIPVVPKVNFWLSATGGIEDDSYPVPAVDSETERYRGNIWRRKSPTIPKRQLLLALRVDPGWHITPAPPLFILV